MVWYKAWLETRSRFLFGLALSLLMAGGLVGEFTLLPFATSGIANDDSLRGPLREAIELSRTFRGFIWYQWFRQNALIVGALFAAVLGTSHIFSRTRAGSLFTLSLPASRRRWFATRAATGLAELFVLIVLPSLLIPVIAPLIGQHYGVGEALVHALCVYLGVTVLFGLALLLSTFLHDTWPILAVCLFAVCVSFVDLLMPRMSLFGVLSAADYFRGGSLPWAGLGALVVVSASLLYLTARKLERVDV